MSPKFALAESSMDKVTASNRRLNRNLVANFVAQFISASMAILFVPSYVKILGIEAYGLIGFYTLIQMFLSVFEMGVYPVLGRHMARFTAGKVDANTVRDVFRTYLILVVVVGACLAVLLGSLASPIAADWFNLSELDERTVGRVIVMIGLVVMFRFIEMVFRSAILGLQFQIIYNAVFSLAAILRYAGVIGFLILYQPTIEAFFFWQIVVSLLALVAYGIICAWILPKSSRRPQFSFIEVLKTRRFAAGAVLITFLSVSLRQVDKIYLSKTIDLDIFGYYAFASILAGIPTLLVGPVYQAYYPRFVELFAIGSKSDLNRAYLRATMYAGIIAVVSGVPLVFFAEDVIWVWSGDRELARGVSVFARVLVIGGILDAMLNIPYCAQIAFGWTRLAVGMFLVSLCFAMLAILIAVPQFGPLSAAWVWVGVNVFLFLLWIPLMYRRILSGTLSGWYVASVATPILVAVTSAFALSVILPVTSSRLIGFLLLGVIGCILLVLVSGTAWFTSRFFNPQQDMQEAGTQTVERM